MDRIVLGWIALIAVLALGACSQSGAGEPAAESSPAHAGASGGGSEASIPDPPPLDALYGNDWPAIQRQASAFESWAVENPTVGADVLTEMYTPEWAPQTTVYRTIERYAEEGLYEEYNPLEIVAAEVVAETDGAAEVLVTTRTTDTVVRSAETGDVVESKPGSPVEIHGIFSYVRGRDGRWLVAHAEHLGNSR